MNKDDNLTYSDDSAPAGGIEINETLDGKKLGNKSRRAEKGNEAHAEVMPKRKGCRWLWGIYIILVMVSIIEPYSASSQQVVANNIYGPLIDQVKYLLFGFVALWLTQKIHYKYIRKTAWFWAVISLVLLVVSLFFGENANGATRAIMIPGIGITLQPGEITKLTTVILLSAIMSKYQIRRGVATRGCIICATIVLVFGGLLYPNGLTNMVLLMAVSIAMFLIGGIELRKLGIIWLAYCVIGGGFLYHKATQEKDENVETEQIDTGAVAGKTTGLGSRSNTQSNRIKRFLAGVNPQDTIDDFNRQVIFAKFAMARGGLTGRGPGTSQESARLPLAFSDYIYSIIVEDAGFIGGILLLLVYIILLFRAGTIAYTCSRTFPALLIMGCSVMIVVQALVHMAIVTGVAPVSGQPLPLISRGGTSIVIMSIAFGMMLSVSKFAVQKGNKKEVTAEEEELPESIQSINPSQIDEIYERK